MIIPLGLGLAFTALAILLAVLFALRRGLTHGRGGKELAFIALLVLPVLATWGGFSQQMHRAESTQFCLTCHVMHSFGKSLLVNDPGFLPARHYQNHFVPPDRACYTCHTTYTMFGPLSAKLEGLRHMYVEYLGKIPPPDKIHLYAPYNNRECLSCHRGMRAFVDEPGHNKKPGEMAALLANRQSCLSCHNTIHDVKDLKYASFWRRAGEFTNLTRQVKP